MALFQHNQQFLPKKSRLRIRYESTNSEDEKATVPSSYGDGASTYGGRPCGGEPQRAQTRFR
ncbi:hypothetical protein GA0061078_1253 [Bifidobacterium bohemicum]|uniref:Uncharacterized protein n=1 Tax=Bifidobacterium bohemicum DSM 22767 TaxID=1437606 RepID=A0A086ZHJ8_9BIFI|nr:hypothetical protein BBOH_0805 [Bifidobacterium bohemicum DSM 22767]SCC04270.1 hypothetical protein GA0061078_1253 [Bifidobacterium bohemicum]